MMLENLSSLIAMYIVHIQQQVNIGNVLWDFYFSGNGTVDKEEFVSLMEQYYHVSSIELELNVCKSLRLLVLVLLKWCWHMTYKSMYLQVVLIVVVAVVIDNVNDVDGNSSGDGSSGGG